MPEVTRLNAYHLPDEDNETVVERVIPIKPPPFKSVPMSEHDADMLEEIGLALCRLGAPETGQRVLNLVAAWKLVGL